VSLFGSFHLWCKTGADVVGSGFRLVFTLSCVSVVSVLFGNKSKDDFLLSRGIGGLRFLFLVGFNFQASLGGLDSVFKSLLRCIAAVAGLMSTAVI
jgi:hypothetical protein